MFWFTAVFVALGYRFLNRKKSAEHKYCYVKCLLVHLKIQIYSMQFLHAKDSADVEVAHNICQCLSDV